MIDLARGEIESGRTELQRAIASPGALSPLDHAAALEALSAAT